MRAIALIALGLIGWTKAAPRYSCFDPPNGEGQTNPLGEGLEDVVEDECCEALIDETDILAERSVIWDPVNCNFGPGEDAISEASACSAHNTDGCRFCRDSCEGFQDSCVVCFDSAGTGTATDSPTSSPLDIPSEDTPSPFGLFPATPSPIGAQSEEDTPAPSRLFAETLAPIAVRTEDTAAPIGLVSETPAPVAEVGEGLTITSAPIVEASGETFAPISGPLVETLAPISGPLTETLAPDAVVSGETLAPTTDGSIGTPPPMPEASAGTNAPVVGASGGPSSPIAEASIETRAPFTGASIRTPSPVPEAAGETPAPVLEALGGTTGPTTEAPPETPTPIAEGLGDTLAPITEGSTTTPPPRPEASRGTAAPMTEAGPPDGNPSRPPFPTPGEAFSSNRTTTAAPTAMSDGSISSFGYNVDNGFNVRSSTSSSSLSYVDGPESGNIGHNDGCPCPPKLSAEERQVLELHGKSLMCDPTCSNGNDEIWGVMNCNYFALGQNCRACADVCTRVDGVWLDELGAFCKPCRAIAPLPPLQ